MVSELARGDYEDLRAEGLSPTLDDFVRLNNLALRLTDGAETTVANFPRIGWAGDVPFYQPTCAAFAWYLEYADRAAFDLALKDACWFYALAHARIDGFFSGLDNPTDIKREVNKWLASLPVTREEIARACRYAATGCDDAEPGKTDAQREADAAKTEAEKREETLANLTETETVAAALTGITPDDLAHETPSRLVKMIEAVRANNQFGGDNTKIVEKNRRTSDYQLAFREIKLRLLAERDAATSTASSSNAATSTASSSNAATSTASSSCREGLQPEAKEVNNGVE